MEPLERDKIIILFSLLICSILAAVIPLIIARAKWVKRFITIQKITVIMDLAQGFGGGVLLGGGLLHLMADASEQISDILTELTNNEAIISYPWAPLLTCTALGIIFFVEIILTAIVSSCQKKKHKQINVEGTDVEKVKLPVDSTATYSTVAELNTPTPYEDEYSHHEHEEEHVQSPGHSHGEISFHDLHGKSKSAALISAIVLWVSLSTHSLFAGLGLGIEKRENSMWSIFAAIIAHKFVEAFAMGSIINEGFSRAWVAILFIIAFSLATPGGIGIGIAIAEQELSPSYQLVQYCLLALASGAFLHVALFEVLFHQPDSVSLKVIRFILFVTGFAVMAVVALWA
jgi:zinc transporter ZupT